MADVVVFRSSREEGELGKLEEDPLVDLEPLERRTAYHFYRDMFSARTAYVRHPHFPHFLIPFGEFNEFVLQDKFNEALRVLTSLGASSIRCSSHRERTRRSGAGGGLRSARAELRRERTSASSFDYEHVGSGGPPVDPRPLRWPGEPGIEAAIAAVMRNGATSVKITVRRHDSVSTNVELPLRLKKVGVDLGLHSTASRVDTLEFVADFPGQRQGRR